MANGHGGARPGAGRKRKPLPTKLVDSAIGLVEKLIEEGDKDAIKLVLDRAYPAMKTIKQSEVVPRRDTALLLSDSFTGSATFGQIDKAILYAMRKVYISSSNALNEVEKEQIAPISAWHSAWLVMANDSINYRVMCVSEDGGFVVDEKFSTERHALDFFYVYQRL